MEVTIDPGSGFCFGVRRAVEQAEKHLERTGRLHSLGDIVHNRAETDRLRGKGLISIDHEGLGMLRGEHILFRAHGEPPSSYEVAGKNNLTLTDATCPIVKKLQQRVKKAMEETRKGGGQVVIYGTPGHPETNGLQGQANGEALVVSEPSNLAGINPKRPVVLFSQTTKSTEGFRLLAENIREMMREHHGDGNIPLKVHNTICRQISGRVPLIREFAGRHDVVVFVGGEKSSNAKVLFSHCREVNPRSHFVTGPEDLDEAWFTNAPTAGVSGATSTPLWLMEKVAARIRELTK